MKPRFFYISILLHTLFSVSQTFGQATPVQPLNQAKKVDSCELKNLYKLNDSVYRSEQPDEAAFACLEKLGVRSELNLRSYHKDSGLLKGLSMKPFTVEMRANKFTDNEIIGSLRIMKSAPKPVLVHCLHGSDRTGVVIAMYRIIFGKWTREEALDELLHGGFGFHAQYDNIVDYIKTVDIELISEKVFNR